MSFGGHQRTILILIGYRRPNRTEMNQISDVVRTTTATAEQVGAESRIEINRCKILEEVFPMVKWAAHYETGIAEFDKQHKDLIDMGGKLSERAVEHGNDPKARLFLIRETMVFLRNYFITHVEKEEAYMRETGFAGYARHKKLHDAFRMRQLVKYENIVNRGMCSREELFDFIGNGVGWLIEHITTDDMEIVRGLRQKESHSNLDASKLETKINDLIIQTLNINCHVKAIDVDYKGDSPRKTVYQKCIFLADERRIEVLSGIEQSFMMNVGRMLYGDQVDGNIGLVLSTLQSFGASFWRSMLLCFDFPDDVEMKESVFLTKEELQAQLADMAPTVSILFDSDQGELFFSSRL